MVETGTNLESDYHRKITLDELRQYLNDKSHSKFDCELCGSDSWAYYDERDYNLGAIPLSTSEAREYSLGPRIETVVLVCENCGNIKQIMARFIRNWRKNRENSGDE